MSRSCVQDAQLVPRAPRWFVIFLMATDAGAAEPFPLLPGMAPHAGYGGVLAG